MKFNISSKTLYNCMSSVSKVINAKNPMPILNNFLFTLKDNTLTVKAADMENSLLGTVEVNEAVGEGQFCLEARGIVELLKVMPDQGVSFNIDDETFEVNITATGRNYSAVAINGAEYPQQEQQQDMGQALTFTVPTEALLRSIDNTLFAVGTDQIRPQLMGILWDVHPNDITFVATDTRKLVKYTDSSIAPGVECSFILPVKGASILKNVFTKDETVEVTATPTGAVFKSANFTFDCRLIKGRFPDYNRVIPKNNPYLLTIDRLSLLNAVRSVAIFGDAGGGLVKFSFTATSVTLSTTDPNYRRSGNEVVPCNYSGNEITIGLGSEYLIEILSTFTTPDISVQIADPSRPILLLPSENEPDTELLMILMPMDMRD